MRFVKMHGTGNDYIYINLVPGYDDSVRASFDESGNLTHIEDKLVADVVTRLSDRHFGIGSDGLIAVAPTDNADVRMIMYNADGSEGSMCGNGIRCVAKFAYERGLLDGSTGDPYPKSIEIETKSGIKKLTLTIEDDICTYVEVNMGHAILTPEEIPFRTEVLEYVSDSVKIATVLPEKKYMEDEIDNIPDGAIVSRILKVDGKNYPVTCVSMGNPHCVVFTDNIYRIDIEELGPQFEHHPAFPEQVNTEFVEVLDDHTLSMRVWERGSGETMSCGTGTCAATVAAVLNGYVKRGMETEVRIRGGKLYDTYLPNGEVLMKGPATTVFEGEVEL
ncbi:MAG TPA: diaminopimelate epimerase [Lachnospiraceae bacterium]|nr:diaminopimelate epimerase [Lachnospiraceae bacterium]